MSLSDIKEKTKANAEEQALYLKSLDQMFTAEILLQGLCDTPAYIGINSFLLKLKRAFDLFFACFALLLLAPLFAVISVIIVISSEGPPIYKQYRKGVNQQSFLIYKFRTMHQDTHEMRKTLFEKNEADGFIFKIKDDPRLFKFGKMLRKYSVDELPQLLNVLKGDMSFIGPRPFSIEVFERKKIDHPVFNLWLENRHKIRPGISGLWQVEGRNDLPFKDLVYYDLYYVTHWNILLDIGILLRTFLVVLSSKGAY
jgi:lipopolysaccharide/colanic/teichoic acid biosynthesis glycosyltransferase